MKKDKGRDPIWQAAWAWARRQHEPGGLDDAARLELAQWLAADAAHRKTYEEAARLWLMVGLVPPANNIPDPDCED
ncbi:FecR/PupR family sigma factor regulator [Variovorax sp. MHTC-1]|uniref:FecR/PupR family sigma factor regulator n=1 Tax=Variovorax sp. MHTC-1 TaxID=2495593 RepID=UPI000F85DFCB|nr:DUF4880 domain-containing protein [Variovorax sp. MHTC-1]RST55762.1 DUF4880 domain-containing protein [Variovorax sp. MHTC-1]